MGDRRSKRRQNFQPITWFYDIYRRELLDMDPPYQRRSVWNDTYREQFIDTILLDYPAPAIFLFQRIDDKGNTRFELVDGKQRLTTVFDFITNQFPVSEESPLTSARGKYFDSLPSDDKIALFEYDFPVEYLPTNNEQVINSIFDRLNRNTAKLTGQELRHARFNGKFITKAEELASWLEKQFDRSFPRIADQSKRQMKDVEVVASLLLYLEEGPRGYSSLALDQAFASRDKEWEQEAEVVEEFRNVVRFLSSLAGDPEGQFITQSRLRNQADFYSLFAAVAELLREGGESPAVWTIGRRLRSFLDIVDNETDRPSSELAASYYDAARSASNDPGSRRTRISTLLRVLKGQLEAPPQRQIESQ